MVAVERDFDGDPSHPEDPEGHQESGRTAAGFSAPVKRNVNI